MKSLLESLFDPDLSSKSFVDSLLKLFKKKLSKSDLDDIFAFAIHMRSPHMDFINDILNPDIKVWAQWFYDKNSSPMLLPMINGMTNKDLDDQDIEVTQWLKSHKIHKDVSWNDRMYANSLEISWDYWELTEKELKNIEEWITFQVKWEVLVVINRKEYDDVSRKLLHALIENISKFKY